MRVLDDGAHDKQLFQPLEQLSPACLHNHKTELAEFRKAIRQLSLRASNEEITELFDRFDRDGTKALGRSELKAAMNELHEGLIEAQAHHDVLERKVEHRKQRIEAIHTCISPAELVEAAEQAFAKARDEPPPLDLYLGRFVVSKSPGAPGGDVARSLLDAWTGTAAAIQGDAADGALAGRMTRAAFVKQLFKHKNVGDVFMAGSEADVRARFESLFDELVASDPAGTADGPGTPDVLDASASAVDLSDASARTGDLSDVTCEAEPPGDSASDRPPTLSIVGALQALADAVRRHDDYMQRQTTEAAKGSAALADARSALAALDEVEAAAEAATEEEKQRRAAVALEAQAQRKAREQKEREEKEAVDAVAAQQREERLALERERVAADVEQQKLRVALSKGERFETREMVRKKGVRVWHGLAHEKITEMASNLDTVLESDAQLKDVFESIDLDRGGSIDRGEVELALAAAGRPCSAEQLDAMMRAADADGGGDVDVSEFKVVLQAVKAANAARAVQQMFRAKLRAQALKGLTVEAAEAGKPQKAATEGQAEKERGAARKVQAIARGKATRKKKTAKPNKK